MKKIEALKKLKLLKGLNIRDITQKYEVTVWKNGKINKGWFGHTIERYLGLPINSSQSPNFGSWELKTISMKKLKNGEIVPKETMAITMIDAFNVKNTPFEESHLFSKLKKMVICVRLFDSKLEEKSILLDVVDFNLENHEVLSQIKSDYELIRQTIINDGFAKLTGKMGVFIQPRTKGAGHGSTSRAFYARISLIKKIIGKIEIPHSVFVEALKVDGD
jgi:DNA mismatch repair protein MutH